MEEYNNPLGLAYVLYARKETQVVVPAGPAAAAEAGMKNP
jgi:hypothetical protein